MEKKIGKIVKHAGIKAGDAMSKAKDVVVQAVDQNGDGKLDLEDVKLVGEQVKHETKKIVDLAQEKKCVESKIFESVLFFRFRKNNFA